MKRFLVTLVLLCAAFAQAFAQVPYFPQTLPGATVVGRLSATPGTTEAIPLAKLQSLLSNTSKVYDFVRDFGGKADNITDNYAQLVTALKRVGGATLYIPAGSYYFALPTQSATTPIGRSFPSPTANTVIAGAGKGVTNLRFVPADTEFVNIFTNGAENLTYRDMTLQVTVSAGSNLDLFVLAANKSKFLNLDLKSNVVEGVWIGGTATVSDTVGLVFYGTGVLTGSPVTISYTVSAGQSTAQIATGLAAAINANTNISSLGVVAAAASSSFVGISQPDTLSPQLTYTTSVTGAATETMTLRDTAGTAGIITFLLDGDATEVSDISLENTDVNGWAYTFLKDNSNTVPTNRWAVRGGRFDRNIHGHFNFNSPAGPADDFLIQGVSFGSVGVADIGDYLPIAFAHVTNARVLDNNFKGTYNQNLVHFEEGAHRFVVANNTATFATSKAWSTGYLGCFVWSGDVTVGVDDGVVVSNTVSQVSGNASGYPVWQVVTGFNSQRWTVSSNTFRGAFAGGIRLDGTNNTVGFNTVSWSGSPVGGEALLKSSVTANAFILNPVVSSAPSAGLFKSYTDRASVSANTANVVDFVGAGPSAVNFFQVYNANTGGSVSIAAASGTDTNVNFIFTSQGAGTTSFYSAGFTAEQFQIAHTASAVDYLTVTGGVTGSPATATLSAAGSDTNVNIAVTPKGSGAILSSNNIGIGSITAPAGLLHSAKDGASNNNFFDTYQNSAATNTSTFILRRARGSFASPAAILAADLLGNIVFGGQKDTTSGDFINTASIAGAAGENFDATHGATSLQFQVTASGSVARSTKMLLQYDGKLGIGSTAPNSTLHVKGHIGAESTAPALTSCGTSPAITGSDTAGIVTMGTAAPTGCIITFATAYASAPNCAVTWQATPLASQSYAVSASAITLTQTATSSNVVNYVCVAQSGG